MCGVAIEYEGTRVLSVRGDDDDPFSKGHICPKATALQTLYEDPDRLRTPVRRVGSRWEPMEWDAALDFAAEGLHAVQERQGRDALGLYLGNPTVHNTGALLMASLFARALRTRVAQPVRPNQSQIELALGLVASGEGTAALSVRARAVVCPTANERIRCRALTRVETLELRVGAGPVPP